ncbi:LytTR family transcriptional regulator DNA-binding domain-containing protein [Microbulbifer salipaludis]|uniref:LytTR family transcriptional regulator DNA-binding domain-containing protein n=1 Tax=Microbulbifer salipaludis TaxID=187980 RepID=A0ABS3E7U6_9GAMM|nr:LytTR family transcriptional regulator DNA-binding domain-containing protein [Microbulbifer salipaludis]MBN8431403.1 LytTR family transcriptional regulator DNA-binding domain-containing protein [Microbulbifer salipaludis]
MIYQKVTTISPSKLLTHNTPLLKNMLTIAFIGVVLGLLGPFGSHEIPRITSIGYWVTSCFVGFAIYSPMITLCHQKLSFRVTREWQRVALACIPAGLLMSGVVMMLGQLFFGSHVLNGVSFRVILVNTGCLGLVITAIALYREAFEERGHQLEQATRNLDALTEQKKAELNQGYQEFMANLPVEKRGALLCLEMADHYLTVHTDKGFHMMLMRLKDATALLSRYPGLQTHRSWWVAHDAVVKVVKDGRKLHLQLSNDVNVPVSRSFIDNVKAAGFGG